MVLCSLTEFLWRRGIHVFKPLVIGKKDEDHYVASESCALDIVGAVTARRRSGEIVVIDVTGGMRSLKIHHGVLPEA